MRGVKAVDHASKNDGIVELRLVESETDKKPFHVLSVRSDFDLNQQITANGATWLNHCLVKRDGVFIVAKLAVQTGSSSVFAYII